MRRAPNDSKNHRHRYATANFAANAAFGAHTAEAQDVTMKGAVPGDHVLCTLRNNGASTKGLIYYAHVRSDNTVEVVCENVRATDVARPSTDLSLTVVHR